MNRKYLFVGFLIVAVGLGVYFYKEYNRKPADLINTDAVEHSTASELLASFSENEEAANKKYLGKIIEVSGIIAEIENQADTSITILLGDSLHTGNISCLMNKNYMGQAKQYKKGQSISIKGFCTGFLMDVELNRCIIKK